MGLHLKKWLLLAEHQHYQYFDREVNNDIANSDPKNIYEEQPTNRY